MSHNSYQESVNCWRYKTESKASPTWIGDPHWWHSALWPLQCRYSCSAFCRLHYPHVPQLPLQLQLFLSHLLRILLTWQVSVSSMFADRQTDLASSSSELSFQYLLYCCNFYSNIHSLPRDCELLKGTKWVFCFWFSVLEMESATKRTSFLFVMGKGLRYGFFICLNQLEGIFIFKLKVWWICCFFKSTI